MKNFCVLFFVVIFILFSSACFADSKSLTASWTYYTDTDVVEFILYSSETIGGPYEELLIIPHVVGQTSYEDEFSMTVEPNTDKTYYFVMTARDAQGNESEYSNEDTARIDVQAPEAVYNLTIEIVISEPVE